jgi:hypothetical protein
MSKTTTTTTTDDVATDDVATDDVAAADDATPVAALKDGHSDRDGVLVWHEVDSDGARTGALVFHSLLPDTVVTVAQLDALREFAAE